MSKQVFTKQKIFSEKPTLIYKKNYIINKTEKNHVQK